MQRFLVKGSLIMLCTKGRVRLSARLQWVACFSWRTRVILVLLAGRVGQKSCCFTHLPVSINSKRSLRELPSSDSSSSWGASVTLESTFDDVVAVQSSPSPCATKMDWIVYFHKKKKGKEKLIKEASSSSSSLLRHRKANVDAAFSLAQAQTDGSHGESSPQCDQVKVLVKVLHGCWTVLSFSARGRGLILRHRNEVAFFFSITGNYQQQGQPVC